MQRGKLFLASLLTIFVAFPQASALRAQQKGSEDQLLSSILDVWRTRQKSVVAFEFSWKRAAENVDIYGGGRQREKTVSREVVELAVSGNKLRLESHEKLPQPYRKVVVCDGNICTKLRYQNEQSKQGYCEITKRSESIELVTLELAPLLMFFRPYEHPLLDLESDAISIEPRRKLVSGRECVVLSVPFVRQVYRLFVEDDGEFFPIRRLLRVTKDGDPIQQVDISYKKDRTIGLVPAVWRTGYDGQPLSRNITVFSYSLAPKIAAGAFKVKIPNGTRVRDTSLGRLREYVAESKNEPSRQ